MKESTTIQFNLNKNSNVKIAIFDVLGREITNVMSKELNQGTCDYSVGRSQLMANGIYLVKIIVDNQLVAKKIVVE